MKYGEAFKEIHFKHEITYYVPCFIVNPGDITASLIHGDPRPVHEGYPTFSYEMGLATTDPQMAASYNPDYIMELTGIFDAKTKPWFSPDLYEKHGNGD